MKGKYKVVPMYCTHNLGHKVGGAVQERYKKFEKILKENLMKEFSAKEKLTKDDLKRILNNLY